METKLTELEEQFGDVKKLIATAVKKSDTVSEEALNLLILKASLPSVNLTDMRRRVDQINDEAFKISEKAKGLLGENIDLTARIDETVRNGEELLEKAQKQQDNTAELLSEVDEAHKIAKDAVARGAQTLEEAQDTLTKLSGKNLHYMINISKF